MFSTAHDSKKQSASTFERSFALAGLAAGAAACVVLRFVNPASSSLFPLCPLKTMTGIDCPGCGATRGMHALLNGDAVTALDYNLMLIIFVPLMVYGAVSLFLLGVRGRGLPYPKRYAAHAAFAFLFVMLAFGVLRNLPFYPFRVLAP
jgi:hypothetical protein